MTIYIAGAISKNPNYKADFENAEKALKEKGFDKIISSTVLPTLFDIDEYIK